MISRKSKRRDALARIALSALLATSISFTAARGQTELSEPVITPNFVGRQISTVEPIELKFDHPLASNDGRYAIFLGETDVTQLFASSSEGFTYTPRFSLLFAGSDTIAVYRILGDGEWKEIA